MWLRLRAKYPEPVTCVFYKYKREWFDQNIRDSGSLTRRTTGIMEDLALSSLPVELILDILSFIDWRTLLVCRQVL